ncbi:PAS fold-containing protein [Filimonas lacunae]|uniref:PAS fold-containing protein n=1 Tax=Filimonas lacunae TaxID=477680 RepID=A0A173MPU8_9BACT|nr:GAF domain-containing protein [Filimonas lacunae]BAV09516.1 phytochrome, two-component sensor histidine kinase [Filimonas lacunae]SIS74515.1 PAS fold-containing protein [Filimonas lacunae]
MSNDKNYDSEFCGSLPIHYINLVQPYGVLLVLDKQALTIVQASENADEIFEQPVDQLLQQPLYNFLDAVSIDILNKKLEGNIQEKIPVSLVIKGRKLLALVHSKEKYLLVELELLDHKSDGDISFVDVYQDVKYSMAAIDQCRSIEDVCTTAARELKKLSGFDKVMIYYFDENWNGTVVAEEREEGMESYMGFTFPASDIPKQARALYLRTPYRFIPDRDYVPVKLYPVINPLTNSFVDLSDCNIRGVAAVHVEYLKNMQVVASMSTRIIHNESLWGLIACHHRTAKPMSYQECSVFELLSNVISAKIASLQNREQMNVAATISERRTQLVEQIYTSGSIVKGFEDSGDNLLSLFNAEGAVFLKEGHAVVKGKVPDKEHLEDLGLWLNAKKLQQVFYHHHLSDVYEHAVEYTNIASGVLVIPVDNVKEEYLVVFRPEVVRTINWGGNPDDAIRFEPDAKNYHPRHSFRLWKQTVRNTSLPWKHEEVQVAESIRSFIYEYTTRYGGN